MVLFHVLYISNNGVTCLEEHYSEESNHCVDKGNILGLLPLIEILFEVVVLRQGSFFS